MRRSSIGQAEKNVWQVAREHGSEKSRNKEEMEGEDVKSCRRSEYTVNGSAVNPRALLRHYYILGFMLLLLPLTALYVHYLCLRAYITHPETQTNAYEEITITKGAFNFQPSFAKMNKVQDLDTQHVPKKDKQHIYGRLIIVGDVHGMKDALIKLLDKVSFDKKKDHLILVGDLITKGPDSVGVIELAMELKASAVRGNHEDRVLDAYAEMKAKNEGVEAEKHNHHIDDEDRHLARSLSEAQITWLKKLPIILRVGKIDGMGEVVVVHAGLVAGIPLEKQNPFHAMNMRTIDMDSHVPSDARDGTSWCKLWNRHQKSLPKEERSTVIYGHDSKRGLQIEKYTKGIDTGCRKGHELTALIIEGTPHGVQQDLVQLSCEKPRLKSEEPTLELRAEGVEG